MAASKRLVSIVIPTYQERHTIGQLLRRIHCSLTKHSYEAIIVDDNSPDGTGDHAEALCSRYPMQVLHRKEKCGLASAVLDGFNLAKGDILGFMDADLSHPPEILPSLITPIMENNVDVVVASRLVDGGGVVGDWPQRRKFNSYVATFLAKPLTSVKDSMSGSFFLKKEVVQGVTLIPRGYKIGLEILVKGNYKKVVEVPFIFDNRTRGKSKLNFRVQVDYLHQIVHLYVYRLKQSIAVRF